MDFDLWKEIGSSFYIQTTINNWIVCDEDEGSLVDPKNGALQCTVVKIMVPGVCEEFVPYGLKINENGYTLTARSNYYHLIARTDGIYPVSDPCGTSASNHLKDFTNLGGWLYLREPESAASLKALNKNEGKQSSSQKMFIMDLNISKGLFHILEIL